MGGQWKGESRIMRLTWIKFAFGLFQRSWVGSCNEDLAGMSFYL